MPDPATIEERLRRATAVLRELQQELRGQQREPRVEIGQAVIEPEPQVELGQAQIEPERIVSPQQEKLFAQQYGSFPSYPETGPVELQQETVEQQRRALMAADKGQTLIPKLPKEAATGPTQPRPDPMASQQQRIIQAIQRLSPEERERLMSAYGRQSVRSDLSGR